MKRKKRILLTGDDGYNSPGTRILTRVLKDDYDVTVVGTVEQQSGVGGHLSIREGGTYSETTVEGVRAIAIDGYPCDGMEFAVGYFDKSFDLIISGINWGMNVGGSIGSSGTVTAAIRGVDLRLSKKAIAMSWFVPPQLWTHRDNGEQKIEEYLDYPGSQSRKIIDLALQNNLWGADVLNINFPKELSNQIRFTRHLDDLRRFWVYPLDRDPVAKTFAYPKKELHEKTRGELDIDTGALLSGYITITPFQTHMLDDRIYRRMKGKEIRL